MSKGFKDDSGTMSICRPKLYWYMPIASQRRRRPVTCQRDIGYPPMKSPTTRAMPMSNAETEKPDPDLISPKIHAEGETGNLTVFPSRGFGQEKFRIQAANDEEEGDADGDEIRSHELPRNGLIVVSRRVDSGTRHGVLLFSSIWSLVSKGKRRKLRGIEWIAGFAARERTWCM